MVKKSFIDKVESNTDVIASNLVDELIAGQGDKSKKNKAQIKEQLLENSKEIKRAFVKGYQIVLDLAERNQFHVPKENFELKKIDYKKHPEFPHISHYKSPHQDLDISLQEAFGYTPKMMRDIYEAGLNLFHQKEFEKAVDVFTFLATLNPIVPSFWQLLGRSLEAIHRHDQALYSFAVAINCDPKNITRYTDCVICCLRDHNYEGALKIIDFGLDVVVSDENPSELKELKNGLEAMKKKIQSKKGV